MLSIPMGGVPSATSFTTIASRFEERTDPAALVIGPTGLGLSADGTLFVADTLRSRIAAISNAVSRSTDAGAGLTVAQGRALKQPLGLAIAPNGNILTVNGGDGLMVETTPGGTQVGVRFVDVSHSRNGAGTLFGLAITPEGNGVYFVDDGNNTLNTLQ
jgi:DNA-binding beta-propeller fold protein YncE